MKKVSYKDLEVLRKLFIPETSEVHIIDTSDRFENSPFQKREKQLDNHALITGDSAQLSDLYDKYERIIEFGSSKGIKRAFKREFRFIRINGSIRWVYPKGQMKSIIDFYDTSTKRGKLMRLGFHFLAITRLDGFISKAMTVHSNSFNCIEIGPKNLNFDDFSIFMAKPGVERTIHVALVTKKKSTHFLKFGMSKNSQRNIENEANILFHLERKSFKNIKVPCARSTGYKGVITISKLSAENKKPTSLFLEQHANALVEISDLSRSEMRFDESEFGKRIINDCISIESEERTSIENLLLKVFNDIPNDYKFSTGLAHGDFTPWNMYLSEGKLFIYDWETSIKSAPLLFDLFHYHFQTGIQLKKWNFNQIYARINFTIESREVIQNEIQKYSINVKRHIQMYLLYIISRKLYLTKLENSDESISAHELSVWKEAMLYVLPKEVENREGFISKFGSFLGKVQHSFLKFNEVDLSALPVASDFEIALHSDDLQKTIRFCTNHKDVKRFKCIKKSFMTTLELFFHDSGYLSIDFIYDFKRKGVRFMDINELLSESKVNRNGVVVPALHHDAEYVLMFYTLSNSPVPKRHFERFENSERENQLRTLRYFFKKYGLEFSNMTDLLRAFRVCKVAFNKKLNKDLRPSFLKRLVAKAQYILDILTERVRRRGFILTFSGVDGIGKSTVIETVKEQLKKKYRREVVLMRYRPKMLPTLSAFKYGGSQRMEANASNLDREPVIGTSILGSYMRFSYYYFDYLFGQFYVYIRYVLAGKIVLYDRYYFDLINHPQRTNLRVNRKFAKWLYRFILKPSLNVFLSADPEIIAKRKQEKNASHNAILTKKYLTLFDEFSRDKKRARYVIHRNDNLSTTVSEILQDIQQIA
ncbi:MAG: hypothetical protein MK066_01495 [Crocinitomicaceae bacterium]|nr:hypothetical protein [Crocinitomicaceae bacterium]